MKFGGASVSNAKNIIKISDIIIEKSKQYKKLVVVVSAMGKTTNKLLKLALTINDNPSKREQDMLISVGERITMSLLSMALQKKGKKSISFTGSQGGIITTSNHLDAKIIDVKPTRVLKALNDDNIVIVAGFQGVSREKEITTLGRGGSDTTAVALAVALKAKIVEFYKDVDGIYEKDPKKDKSSFFYEKLSHEKALKILEKNEHKILHPRCVKLASNNNISLNILNFKNRKNKKFTNIEKVSFKKGTKNVYEIN
ncbi:MAG: Aspartokinase [Candidatus Anoxychlamydiales bacterium]|nr:Aspartokinase [Candidatus Anoxychlamydiales bacterium]